MIYRHPDAERVRKYIYFREERGGELRRNAPPSIVALAQTINGECCACRADIKFLRMRQGMGTIYLALTCPNAENPGCGRSGEAADEYLRVEEWVRTGKVPPTYQPRMDME